MVELEFSAERGGTPAGDDSRTRAFRILACGRGAGTAAAASIVAEVTGGWPASVIAARAAEIDWQQQFPSLAGQLPPGASSRFLHVASCRDFTLMAREHWWDVRGYPEAGPDPPALEAVLNYAAHHAGAHEEVLPAPYRIYRAAASAEVPAAPGADPLALIAQMRYLDAPVILNRDDWGLAAETLAEFNPNG
jgi:hypothetical protein